jgi:N-terminal domain of anti-restriction factor ArdC
VPCNAVSNRPYSGCNVVLLWMAASAGYRTPRYLTFKQALELGGNVRKGEHGHRVYFVKQLQVREPDSDDVRIVPMLREYTVFNVDQCEGLPDRVLAQGPIRVDAWGSWSCAHAEHRKVSRFCFAIPPKVVPVRDQGSGWRYCPLIDKVSGSLVWCILSSGRTKKRLYNSPRSFRISSFPPTNRHRHSF